MTMSTSTPAAVTSPCGGTSSGGGLGGGSESVAGGAVSEVGVVIGGGGGGEVEEEEGEVVETRGPRMTGCGVSMWTGVNARWAYCAGDSRWLLGLEGSGDEGDCWRVSGWVRRERGFGRRVQGRDREVPEWP